MSHPNFLIVALVCFIAPSFVAYTFRKTLKGDSRHLSSSSTTNPSSSNSEPESNSTFHSAILISGARQYGSYQHQADICHVYHTLLRNGLESDNIIIFVADDIAYHRLNPFQGGKNVFPGCNKDYVGRNARKEVLLHVLHGNATAVKKIGGSGRVLKKNPNQRLLFVHSTLGGCAFVGFPYGPVITAEELNQELVLMKNNGTFKEVMIYMDSKHSESMFSGMKIQYADWGLGVSSSSPPEDAYPTYCPSSKKVYSTEINPNRIGVCMGTLFTVAWLEDSEAPGGLDRTILVHLKRVGTRLSIHGCYDHGTHVSMYGDIFNHILFQPLGRFLRGDNPATSTSRQLLTSSVVSPIPGQEEKNYKQEDAGLVYLYERVRKNNDSEAAKELEREMTMRRHTDEVIYASLEKLARSGSLPANTSISSFAEEAPNRGPHQPAVDDWNCLKRMTEVWEEKCGQLNAYVGRYSCAFANLCNAGVEPSAFKEALTCQKSIYSDWELN